MHELCWPALVKLQRRKWLRTLYFWMRNIKIAFSVNETEGTSPKVCGTWKYSAQIIPSKHRLCQLSIKPQNHRRPLETERWAGKSEESSRQWWKEPVGSHRDPQLWTHTDTSHHHRMSVKLLLKWNIAYTWHNPWKKPEPALIQNTTDDTDKKDPNCILWNREGHSGT